MRTKFAKVEWMVEDVLLLKPNWTRRKAAKFLERIESSLEDRTIERGWDVLEDLIATDEEKILTGDL